MKWNNITLYLLLMLVVGVNTVMAQTPSPAPAQQKPVALMNGVAHLGNGEVIENAVVTFENGKIQTVADARRVRMDLKGYEIIELNGKHIYPGLILPNTNLGLVEVDAVRATVDFREVGAINPNVRSIIAYNAESELIPTLRFNGILLAQITPQGGLVSGTSSIVQLDAWNWEDAAYKLDDGLHMNWPSRFYRTGWWAEPGGMKKNEKYEEQVNKVEQLLADAKAYSKLSSPNETNLKLKYMKGLFDGSQSLFIHVDKSKEIVSSVKMAQKYGIQRIVLVGGEEALLVKDFIKKNNLPIILSNVHRLPSREEEPVDQPYQLPFLLHKEGIMVSLGYEGVMSSRNLPFFAGTAAAYGLDKEEALKMITSNTAKILNIDERTGTLEAGKDANIVISEGDLLDMKTSKVEKAFIQGRMITLEAKQQKLYEKYKKKYEEESK